MNNQERADRAFYAVVEYGDDDARGNAGDFLADLFHLAKREGWNLDKMVLMARVNFEEEL